MLSIIENKFVRQQFGKFLGFSNPLVSRHISRRVPTGGAGGGIWSRDAVYKIDEGCVYILPVMAAGLSRGPPSCHPSS